MANPANNNGDERDLNRTEDQPIKDHGAISSRLSELGAKLDRVNARRRVGNDAKGRSGAIGTAYRLTVELVVGLVVGGFLGWWVDYILGTTPVFLLIFFVLGMSAGILNVFKAAKKMQALQEAEQEKQDFGTATPVQKSLNANDD